jgi:uncharacterized protein (DUF952 family)
MILHITTRKQWEEAISLGIYTDSSLVEEGFIHCSTQQQILRSANRYYHGRSDLLLLCIALSKIEAPIIFEDSYQKGEAYPHIYGSLNLDAVMYAFEFPTNTDGSFSLLDDFCDQFET